MAIRTTPILAITLGALLCALQVAHALDRDDTMAAWRSASEAERSSLLDQLRDANPKLRAVDRSKVLDCLNGAAAFPQHEELRIGDIAEACAEPPSDEPGNTDT